MFGEGMGIHPLFSYQMDNLSGSGILWFNQKDQTLDDAVSLELLQILRCINILEVIFIGLFDS